MIPLKDADSTYRGTRLGDMQKEELIKVVCEMGQALMVAHDEMKKRTNRIFDLHIDKINKWGRQYDRTKD